MSGIEAVAQDSRRPQAKPGGYITYLRAAFGHSLLITVRRQRIVLAAAITMLPVLIPLAMAFLSPKQFAEDGSKVFSQMLEQVHINVLAPLLALFFGTMLVGEDIETQTLPFMLTRPIFRSAWVFGRFISYLAVSAFILLLSVALTFAACTALDKLTFDRPGIVLLLHYAGVAFMALAGYGAVTVFLGVTTKRPIVIGVLLLYGWQRLATLVPGLIDFFTIQKYTDAILPKLATQRANVEIQTVLGTFQKEVFIISGGKALIVLSLITLSFLIGSTLALRWREFAGVRAAGS